MDSETVSRRVISVRIDGRQVDVDPGTSVAAALWNAGIHRFRVSATGEARGPVCAMGICFECRVTIDGQPHRRACMIRCAAGMTVDTGAARAVPATGAAGFAASAPRGEGSARRSPDAVDTLRADVVVIGAGPAGIAAACSAAEAGASVLLLDEGMAPGGQIWRHAPPDGASSGAGARQAAVDTGHTTAGVAAAISHAGASDSAKTMPAAAGDGRGAIHPGGGGDVRTDLAAASGRGSVRADTDYDLALTSLPGLARRWCRRLAASGAVTLCDTAVLDVAPGPVLLAERAGRPLRIHAARVVLATGARELFLPFPGWTLPNVLGVGGAQALLKSGARFDGLRVVVAGSGPLLLPVAASLARAGARLVVVAEQAPVGAVTRFAAGLWRHPRRLAQAARYRAAFWHTPYRTGVWVAAATGGGGQMGGERQPGRDSGNSLEGGAGAVREVVLTDGRKTWREACDVLACAYGLLPNLGLARLFGCELTGGTAPSVQVDGRQQTSVAGVYCAGEATGVGGLDLALASGQIAGLCAAGRPPAPRRLRALARRRDRQRRLAGATDRAFAPRETLRHLATPDTLACRCEDVPLGRLDAAWTPRQAKLYTRAGMGACQGRVCGSALAHQFGWSELDPARPPVQPASLGVLAALGDLDATDAIDAAGPATWHSAPLPLAATAHNATDATDATDSISAADAIGAIDEPGAIGAPSAPDTSPPPSGASPARTSGDPTVFLQGD
jgi:D-hydroxyproline dehydrogenase subunit alpha